MFRESLNSSYPNLELVINLPLIEIYLGMGALTTEQKINLAKKITDLVVKEAKQPRQYTWIMFHELPGENWVIGGLTLPELKAKLKEEMESK